MKPMNQYAEIVVKTIYGDDLPPALLSLMDDSPVEWRSVYEIAKSHINDMGGFKANVRASLNGASYEILSAIGNAQCDLAETSNKPTFKLLTYFDIINMPPRDMLVSGLIARRDLCLMFGESGGGKTFVTLDLITNLISGNQFADSTGFSTGFDIPRPLNVTYCTGEGQGGIKDRLKAVVDARGLTDSDLARLSVYYDPMQLFSDDFLTMREFVTQHARLVPATDVLIIDTLNTSALGADENSAKDMGKMLSRARMAIQELNCAVIVIHHAGKNSPRERGSSALRASCDVMLEVSDNALHCSKLKDGVPFQPIYFSIKPHLDSAIIEWSDSVTGKTKVTLHDRVMKIFTDTPGIELTSSAIAQALGIASKNKTLLNTLNDLTENKKKLQRKASNPAKAVSGHNPWTYYV